MQQLQIMWAVKNERKRIFQLKIAIKFYDVFFKKY